MNPPLTADETQAILERLGVKTRTDVEAQSKTDARKEQRKKWRAAWQAKQPKPIKRDRITKVHVHRREFPPGMDGTREYHTAWVRESRKIGAK